MAPAQTARQSLTAKMLLLTVVIAQLLNIAQVADAANAVVVSSCDNKPQSYVTGIIGNGCVKTSASESVKVDCDAKTLETYYSSSDCSGDPSTIKLGECNTNSKTITSCGNSVTPALASDRYLTNDCTGDPIPARNFLVLNTCISGGMYTAVNATHARYSGYSSESCEGESVGVQYILLNECITLSGSKYKFSIDEGCFSANGKVMVQNQEDGSVRVAQMNELVIGDYVQTSATDKFEPILYFSRHWGKDNTRVDETGNPTQFLQLSTDSASAITLTGNHLIFVSQKDGSLKEIPARDVAIGDKLQTADGNLVSVTAVQIVTRNDGTFLPVTLSGRITVDGVQASCYAESSMHRMGMFKPVFAVMQTLFDVIPLAQYKSIAAGLDYIVGTVESIINQGSMSSMKAVQAAVLLGGAGAMMSR